MKKTALLGLVALGLFLVAALEARAWKQLNFSSQMRFSCICGDTSCLWGLYRSGQVPNYGPGPIMPAYDYAPPIPNHGYAPVMPPYNYAPPVLSTPGGPPAIAPMPQHMPQAAAQGNYFNAYSSNPVYYPTSSNYAPQTEYYNHATWYGW